MYKSKEPQSQKKFSSDLEDDNQSVQIIMKASEAIQNVDLWVRWLGQTYQSYHFANDGKKTQGQIIDNCPACGGVGHIGVTVKRQGILYSESEACPICLTGREKALRLGIRVYQQKPECQFISVCPIKNKALKDLKCGKCVCKFDKELKGVA